MSPRAAREERKKAPRQRAHRRPPAGDGGRRAWIGAALVALTVLVLGQVVGFGFVAWDDPAYVSENPYVRGGLTGRAITWAFTSVHGGHWHPLTSLSHMLDCQIYGVDPTGHHLTSLLLHTANVVLLFLALAAMTGATWRSAFVAALFAVHPLHVETVAWISDRKDLLSTFFGFATLVAYAAHAGGRSRRAYAAAVVLFGLGLMAKATLVTLPILLLLLDFWPLDRWRERRRIIVEKIPFVVLAIASVTVTALVVRGLPESLEHGAQVSFADRLANALVSYARYLAKTIWPTDLTFLYPHPNLPGGDPWSLAQVAAAAAVLLALSVVVFRLRHRGYPVVGWLWYLVMLAPVIGIVQVGPQAMADRYAYVPLVGVFLVAAWGGADLAAALPQRLQAAVGAVAVMVVVVCAGGSWQQARYWSDSELLFRHALEVAPRAPVVHTNLAVLLRASGRLDEAIEHLQTAVEVDPDLPQAQYVLGNAYAARKEPALAIEHYQKAVAADPGFVLAHYNLARILAAQGRSDEAIAHFEQALAVRPDFVQAQNDLGYLLQTLGRLDEAIAAYRKALAIRPDARIHRNLARALAAQGKAEEAAEHWRRAGGG